MKFNPDSFSEKLILNGIDKLVFTLLLMLILVVWTRCQEESERSQIRGEEVYSIKIQRPIKLVEELSVLIRQFILFMQRVSGRSLGDLPEKDKEQFDSLLLNIRLNIGLIKSYSRGRAKTTCAAGKLGGIVETVSNDILGSPSITSKKLKDHKDNLYEQFIVLSDSTLDETFDAISTGSDTRDREAKESC